MVHLSAGITDFVPYEARGLSFMSTRSQRTASFYLQGRSLAGDRGEDGGLQCIIAGQV